MSKTNEIGETVQSFLHAIGVLGRAQVAFSKGPTTDTAGAVLSASGAVETALEMLNVAVPMGLLAVRQDVAEFAAAQQQGAALAGGVSRLNADLLDFPQ